MKRLRIIFFISVSLIVVVYLFLFNLIPIDPRLDEKNDANDITNLAQVRARQFKTQQFNASQLAKSLSFFSKCYCQKDLIYVNKFDETKYEITIRTNENELVDSYFLDSNEFDALKLTCDVYNSLRRGPRQKIISYSYTKDYLLLDQIDQIVEDADLYYPKWIVRVYYSSSILSQRQICTKQCLKRTQSESKDDKDVVLAKYENIDFCNVDEIPLGIVDKWSGDHLTPMSWRWLPLGDDFVEIFISRDLKSCFIDRELAAVNEWLESDKSVHIMRGTEDFCQD